MQILDTFEKRVVNPLVAWLTASSAARCAKAGYTLNLVMFTERAPCNEAGFMCEANIQFFYERVKAELDAVGVGFNMAVYYNKLSPGNTNPHDPNGSFPLQRSGTPVDR